MAVACLRSKKKERRRRVVKGKRGTPVDANDYCCQCAKCAKANLEEAALSETLGTSETERVKERGAVKQVLSSTQQPPTNVGNHVAACY